MYGNKTQLQTISENGKKNSIRAYTGWIKIEYQIRILK